MRTKVCGITLIRDLRLAEGAGAEYVGFVVEAESPRSVATSQAAILARAARAKAVYVVVDMPPEHLLSLVSAQAPAALQLHGHETPDYIAALAGRLPEGVELWKAVSVSAEECDEAELSRAVEEASNCADAGVHRVLLDARVGARTGGTGRRLPLEAVAFLVDSCSLPCIVAGGLGPKEALEVWQRAKPWAVDLSSRLEKSPGTKDPAMMRELAAAIRAGKDA